jgi:hypothetical protein
MEKEFELLENSTLDTPYKMVFSSRNASHKIKESALYHTVLKLKNEKNYILSRFKIAKRCSKDGQVFYIKFATKPSHHIFQNYQFSESHLTIHQYFQDKSKFSINGLSLAHYTEIYKDDQAEKQIVIHVYFTNQGFYQHTQAKQYTGDRINQNFIELELDAYSDNLIRENSKTASVLLIQLLEDTHSFYTQSLVKAHEIDTKLQVISKRFSKKSVIDYINLAKDLIKAIEEINLFSVFNIKDRRDKIIKKHIHFLQSTYLSSKQLDFRLGVEKRAPGVYTLVQEDASDENNNAENPSAKSIEETLIKGNTTERNEDSKETIGVAIKKTAAKKQKRNAKKDKDEQIELLDYITSQENNLKKLNSEIENTPHEVHLRIHREETVKNLQLSLLKFSNFISFTQKHNRKRLDALSDFLDKDEGLLDVFIKEFWLCNLNAVQELFPHIQHCLSGIILCKILPGLINFYPSNEEIKIKLKKVFDFLYQNSGQYRFLVSIGLLLKWEVSELCTSLLFAACTKKNLFAFNLLLEHGAHPNSVGLFIDNIQIPAIYLITLNADSLETMPYLELALKHGGHYTVKPKSTSAYIPDSYCKFLKKYGITKYSNDHNLKELGKNNVIDDGSFKNQIMRCKNLIDFCFLFDRYLVLEKLLPQMKFKDTLKVLAKITNQKTIRTRHIIPSAEVGCKVVKNHSDLEMVTREKYDNDLKRYSILVYSDQPNMETCLDIIEKLVNDLQIKRQLLTEKFPEALKKIQEDFLEATRQVPANHKDMWIFDAFRHFLLLESEPTFMTYQMLMQLNCRRAIFIKKSRPAGDNEFLIEYYLAGLLAESSQFAKQLMATPLYAFIVKQINNHIPVNMEPASKDLNHCFSNNSLS